jgi:hypothetical protein
MFDSLISGGIGTAVLLLAAGAWLCRKEKQHATPPQPETLSYVTEDLCSAPSPSVVTLSSVQASLSALEVRLDTRLLTPEIKTFLLFQERTGLLLFARLPEQPAVPAGLEVLGRLKACGKVDEWIASEYVVEN